MIQVVKHSKTCKTLKKHAKLVYVVASQDSGYIWAGSEEIPTEGIEEALVMLVTLSGSG